MRIKGLILLALISMILLVMFPSDVFAEGVGDSSQYNYDETDADHVTVYVTISNNGIPLMGNEGTVLAHLTLILLHMAFRIITDIIVR